MRLKDRVALVTGGASGIGRAVSVLLAREGADVAVADLQVEGAKQTVALVKEEGRRGVALKVDVTKMHDVQMLVDGLAADFGHIDILINNAGILESAPVLDMTEAQWHRSISVMLDGAFFVAQAVARQMVEKKIRGSIVSTTSICSFVALRGSAAYCAAKAGLYLLTRVMALELAEYGIRVNCVSPGYVETPMVEKMVADPAIRERMLSEIPMGRFGQPEDIANMMMALTADEASWVTGANLFVDGGMMVTCAKPSAPAPNPGRGGKGS